MENNSQRQKPRCFQPIEELLQQSINSKDLARRASYSVAQFYRKFDREVGESPFRLRRRLLLERAAFELTRSDLPVFQIALNARFNSFEGFSRTFRRTYGVPPKRYRLLKSTDFRLKPEQPIHYVPAMTSESPRQGELAMNLIDRLCGSHYISMKMILDRCQSLTEEQLDTPVRDYYDPLPWMKRENQTIRTLMQHIVGDGTPWPGVAPDKEYDTRTVKGLLAALESSRPRFVALLESHEKDELWDLTFVDSECDPPLVFSYGGWIGHTIVFQNYRRIALMKALEAIGITDLPYCDPVNYQGDNPGSVAKWSLEK